jgi:hypothetical protein
LRAICDYLSRSTLDATFSVELWQYAVYPVKSPICKVAATYIFLLERVFPYPSIPAQIEAQREEANTRRWMRIEFMREVKKYLEAQGIWLTRSGPYAGSTDFNGHDIWVLVPRGMPHACLSIPDALEFQGDMSKYSLRPRGDLKEDGYWWAEFSDVDAENLTFETQFGDRLIEVIRSLKPRQSDGNAAG